MTTEEVRSPLPAVPESWLPREHSLHRPRHGGRQRLALISAIVFFLLPTASFALGVRPSEFENRRLTEFPSPLQGWSFFSQLNPWATDHLALREQAVHLADGVSRGVFGEPPSLGAKKGQQGVDGINPNQTSTQPAPPISFAPTIDGKDGWLYLGEELASHCGQAQPTDATVAQLRALRDGVVASGRKFVVIIAPDKATMVPEHLPDNFPGKACHSKVTEEFWRAMSGEDYVLDVREDLHKWGRELGAPVYGPLDAHWGDEGGVIMARRVAEKLRQGISSQWKVNEGPKWQVPADLPPLAGRTGTTSGRFYSILPDGVRDQTRQVTTEYMNPLHFGTASGPGTYGLGVGLLGDSFTIRATRYLASAFGDITLLHHAQVDNDEGKAAGKMLADNSTVVIEVAERILVSGQFAVLKKPVAGQILAELAAHPIR